MAESTHKPGGLSAERKALLAKLLAEKGIRSDASQVIPARPAGADPLSYAQQRLWYLDQIGAGSAYNMQLSVRLTGELDTSALREALDTLVERHAVLRTSFPLVEGAPVQRIAPPGHFALEEVDLRELDEAARHASMSHRVREDAERRFDMAVGPLFRGTAIRLATREHVLLLTLHHAISDGWSMGIFIRELGDLYRAISRGEAPDLAPLPIQYADFAHWQREWLASGALDQQLGYWRKQLAGAPTLELQTDRPRPATQTFDGARHTVRFPEHLARELEALGQRAGTTFFMTTLAGFQALLGRYSGQDDIVIGSPIANRGRSELEALIGFFVNNLVLRTELSGEPSVLELLARVREVAVGAYEHQDLPFEELVKDLRPERDASRHPIYQIMFSVESKGLGRLDFGELEIAPVPKEAITARFELEVEIEREPEGARCSFIYNTELFDAATIERLAAHYESLLGAMAARPDARVSALPLLGAEEQRRILDTWNATYVALPAELQVQRLFEERARIAPDAVAVAFDGGALTYAALNRRANELARELAACGVAPEVRVGICMERSPEMIVGILATLKAGGAYLPLDPEYPTGRLAFMLADAGASVLLTQERLRDRFADGMSGETRVLCLDRYGKPSEAAEAEEPSPNPACRTHPGNTAYVIYTSGSTGQPKGVCVAHESLANLVYWHRDAFSLEASDRTTQLASTAFDASVWEIWPTLTAGASLHLVARDVLLSPAALRDWLVSNAISVSFVPTPIAEPMLRLAWPQDTALRTLLTGGDKLHHPPGEGLPFDVVNNYGPTENTVVSTSGIVPPADASGPPPAIGRPIANTRLYVLDPRMEPVPAGVPGELYLGGNGLARGYLDRPGMTAERFIPNPFSDHGARLYRTGDRVRWRATGALEFLGRIDQQVKLRGFRIELGEIEATLLQHPGVADAAVAVRGDAPGGRKLVAYVVGRANEPLELDGLRSYLKEQLPGYMVPAVLVPLDALPLNPNGKVDRKALPAPDGSHFGDAANRVAPRTPAEKTVARIWRELLELDEVGVHDNFFDLGGHSLLFTQVVVALEAEFDRKLEPRELLFRSLEQIAAICTSEAQRSAEGAPAVSQRPVVRRSRPLFFGDEARPLFGCHHAARGASRESAVVLCYPMGEEYVHFHRAFRQLADDLAGAGFPVLRFDFYGCGDSSGESDQADLGRWLEDVALAIEEARRETGLASVGLVGFRLGATLALMGGAQRDDVDAIVLLDPVVHGDRYLAELREWNAKVLRYASVRRLRQRDEEEILGFGYGARLIAELEALNLEDLAASELARPTPTLVVESREQHYTDALCECLAARGAPVSHRHLPNPELWQRTDRFQLEDVNRVQMPHALLQAAVSWLSEERT